MKDLLIILGSLFLLAIVWGGWVAYESTRSGEGGVACTLDAKECPDGSYVGRVAPDCEFVQCSGDE